MYEWSEHAVIVDERIRREVRFISTDTGLLYVSLYVAMDLTSALRLVVCPPWHADGDYGFEIAYHLCAGVAKSGGAAAVFHWPGHGESDGDPRTLTIDQFVSAGEAVVDEVLATYGPGTLAIAGVQVGAVPAVGIARSRHAERLLLIEPDLDVEAHYSAIERMARRTSLGKERPKDWAASRFIPQHLREAPVPVHPLLVGDPSGTKRSAVVRYEQSSPIDYPNVEDLTVPGSRRRRSPDHHLALREAAIDWLVESANA